MYAPAALVAMPKAVQKVSSDAKARLLMPSRPDDSRSQTDADNESDMVPPFSCVAERSMDAGRMASESQDVKIKKEHPDARARVLFASRVQITRGDDR